MAPGERDAMHAGLMASLALMDGKSKSRRKGGDKTTGKSNFNIDVWIYTTAPMIPKCSEEQCNRIISTCNDYKGVKKVDFSSVISACNKRIEALNEPKTEDSQQLQNTPEE